MGRGLQQHYQNLQMEGCAIKYRFMKLDQVLGLTPSKENEPIATGFRELDRKTGGLRIGHVCTIGARPGMGRTAFVISLLRNIGVINKVPSAFLSLEHDEIDVFNRLKASLLGRSDNVPDESSVNFLTPEVITTMEQIGFVKCEPPKRKNPQEVLQMMKEAPVWIEHDANTSFDEIINCMERLRQENHVRIVFIDSLQWIDLAGSSVKHSEVLLKLHGVAQRLQIAIVLTTNVNNYGELRNNFYRPDLSYVNYDEWKNTGLYSSMVMLVYRPEYYGLDNFEDYTPAKNKADIMVEKNKFGGVGYVRMHFDNHVSFRELNDANDYDYFKEVDDDYKNTKKTSFESQRDNSPF